MGFCFVLLRSVSAYTPYYPVLYFCCSMQIAVANYYSVTGHASDGKGSLAGLSDMFDKLLRDGRDPLEAVKIVVALVVGDGRP